jgi:hypothetical protein
MHQLEWRDAAGNLMAFARGKELIADVLPYRGRKLAVWVWPVRRLSYGPHVAGRLSCMYPINAIFPAYKFLVDGKLERGSCLIMPGDSNLGRIAHPSYSNSVVFHVPDFFSDHGVTLTDLVLSLPSVVQRHVPAIKEAFAGERS